MILLDLAAGATLQQCSVLRGSALVHRSAGCWI